METCSIKSRNCVVFPFYFHRMSTSRQLHCFSVKENVLFFMLNVVASIRASKAYNWMSSNPLVVQAIYPTRDSSYPNYTRAKKRILNLASVHFIFVWIGQLSNAANYFCTKFNKGLRSRQQFIIEYIFWEENRLNSSEFWILTGN